jgi:AsmA protein
VAENLKLSYGRNKVNMKGFYQNLFPYMLGTGPLLGGLSLQADKLYLDDFLANTDGKSEAVAEAANASASGVIMVPADLSLTLDADVKDAFYEKFTVTGIKGVVVLDNGRILLKDAGMGMAGAKATMNASYSPISPAKALFDVNIKADSFDIHRFYKEVPLFAEMAPAAAKAKGQVSMQYKLGGRLDANMMPVMPSLNGGGTLSLHNVQINGLKLFTAVSKATGKDSMDNPNLKKVDITTSIANNVMTIQRTKMRIFGFRPRMEGQVILDGKLNLQFRLGLPPLGIIGIPMSITGTSENPIVKMRKGKDEDELDETEDEKD